MRMITATRSTATRMWPRCLRTCASPARTMDSSQSRFAEVPTRHQLRAALRVMRVLDRPTTRIADLRHAYLPLPSGGVFHVDDLIAGEALLVEAGRVGHDADVLMVSSAFAATLDLPEEAALEVFVLQILAARAPVWLAAAATNEQLRAEFIPD